jgi:zinc/manganese transport system substrate-binding protein
VHVYEPTPMDLKKVSEATVIVTNGLGLEGWITRLIAASGTKAQITEASRGVVPRTFAAEEASEGQGVVDPHAFQSVSNAKIYVNNIAAALCAADEKDCPAFKGNASAYIAKLDGIEREVKESIGKIPAEKRRVITSHDAFGYFAHQYGLTFLAPEGVSTEAEASAADVAKIVQQIREQKASALFVENITERWTGRNLHRHDAAQCAHHSRGDQPGKLRLKPRSVRNQERHGHGGERMSGGAA